LALGYVIKEHPLLKIDLVGSRALAVYRPSWLTAAMRFITDLGYFKTGSIVIIIAAAVLAANKYYRLALLILLSTAAALWADIFKYIFARPRPNVELLGFNPIHASGWSYPSGHATFSAAVYGFMIIIIILKVKSNKKYFIAALPTLLLIAILFSRVYLGAHFFTDVIGGLFLGLAWALLLSAFL